MIRLFIGEMTVLICLITAGCTPSVMKPTLLSLSKDSRGQSEEKLEQLRKLREKESQEMDREVAGDK